MKFHFGIFSKIIAILYLSAIMSLCIYPPWYRDYGKVTKKMPNSWAWLPPEQYTRIDFDQLSLELIAATACAGIAFIGASLFKKR